MKQQISEDQFNELTDEQKEKLINWYSSIADYTRKPLLNIGQMIALIQDYKNVIKYNLFDDREIKIYKKGVWHEYYINILELDFIDDLWIIIKALL